MQQNKAEIPFQITLQHTCARNFQLVEKLCTTCERLSPSCCVFAHFSLAWYASIRDNPALSNSDVDLACTLGRGRSPDIRGTATQHFPARAEPRSLQKDADGPAFHSFFTSVEIARDEYSLCDDNSHPNWA
jgi:hypothetical protein